jgi:hypothetical protein
MQWWDCSLGAPARQRKELPGVFSASQSKSDMHWRAQMLNPTPESAQSVKRQSWIDWQATPGTPGTQIEGEPGLRLV